MFAAGCSAPAPGLQGSNVPASGGPSGHALVRRRAGSVYRKSVQVSCAKDDDVDASWASSPLSIFCPILKAFSSYDPASPPPRWLEVATSGFASIARLPYGKECNVDSQQDPPMALQLYEFEACPFCRRVREAVTDLDLTVEVYPCPKDSQRHRAIVLELGGKEQFPLLVDPNTGTQMYESDAIVRYLYEAYGRGAQPPPYLLESTLVTGWMPTLLRIGRGMVRSEVAVPDAPAQLLTLYNYENNQFARLVRETLCELELPYTVVSAGVGSKNRDTLQGIQGKTTVPFLVDPNTDKSIGDSEKIIEYLYTTYGTLTPTTGSG